jgi:hypothetical protein
VVPLCARVFSEKLNEDVEKLLKSFSDAPSKEVLEIAAKLDHANNILAVKFPTFKPVPVHELFPPFIHAQIDATSKETEDWVTDTCERELWEPAGANQFFSSSAKEMLRTVMDPLNAFRQQGFLDPALMQPPQAKKTFLVIYGERVVAKGIQSYSTQIYRQFFAHLPFDEAFASKLKRIFPRKAPLPVFLELVQQSLYPINEKTSKKAPLEAKEPEQLVLDPKELALMREELIITNEMCVMISNIAHLQDMVKRLAKQYETEFKSDFLSTSNHLEHLVYVLTLFLVFWVGMPLLLSLLSGAHSCDSDGY